MGKNCYKLSKGCVNSPCEIFLAFNSSLNDGVEISSLERSAADKTAVNVLLRKQLSAVLSVHRAAVLNCNSLCGSVIIQLSKSSADECANFLSLVSGSGLAGADCPNRLVSDNGLFNVLSRNVEEVELDLTSDNFFSDVALALPKQLAYAKDRLQTGS